MTRTEPSQHDRWPEGSYDQNPKGRSDARAQAMAEGVNIATTYTPIDDTTERMSWTNPQGQGFTYKQVWMCGLANAPDVGQNYIVKHDEWIRGNDGEYTHIIHDFELVP